MASVIWALESNCWEDLRKEAPDTVRLTVPSCSQSALVAGPVAYAPECWTQIDMVMCFLI